MFGYYLALYSILNVIWNVTTLIWEIYSTEKFTISSSENNSRSPYLVTIEGCWTLLSLKYFLKFFDWHSV